jgi:hypothetical protein
LLQGWWQTGLLWNYSWWYSHSPNSFENCLSNKLWGNVSSKWNKYLWGRWNCPLCNQCNTFLGALQCEYQIFLANIFITHLLLTEGKFLFTKFELGGRFGMSLEGDCHEVEVNHNMELLVTFDMSLEGVSHEPYTWCHCKLLLN